MFPGNLLLHSLTAASLPDWAILTHFNLRLMVKLHTPVSAELLLMQKYILQHQNKVPLGVGDHHLLQALYKIISFSMHLDSYYLVGH